MKWKERMAERLFGEIIEARVRNAVKAVDDRWWRQIGEAVGPHDRQWHELQADLDDALTAWRTNPLAARIVALTTDYVVGAGIRVTSDDPWVQRFIDRIWYHPKNRLDLRVYRWCDELTRSGELFLVLSTNLADGISYIREVPASRIDRIETDPDDLERELRYHELTAHDLEGRWWPSPEADGEGFQPQVMVHYAINRPVGCVRGQGDLVPILPWLRRYKEWLEDRVRVNRYKSAFLWQVTLRGATAAQIQQKRAQYRHIPTPGSILVTDENEIWKAIQPEISAWDAESDGKAIRLMVAAGAGVPLHFLSEGESATRATAAEMGGPTLRHYYHRQLLFGEMLKDLLRLCVERARRTGHRYGLGGDGGKALGLRVEVQDLDREDNRELAAAAHQIVEALAVMKAQGWVDDETAMRVAYKFAGEVVDVPALLRKIRGT